MANQKILQEGITYDDVLLVPDYSEVLPRDTSLKTKLTTGIDLNIPFISAAMDTVTDAKMARAIAREGGIGVIHKNMSIDEQASQIDQVKRSESGMIMDPVTLTVDKSVGNAVDLMAKYSISGIPIVDDKNKLIGIITNRDLRFNPNRSESVSEIMTKENIITAPEGTTLEDAEQILQSHRIEKLPVVNNNNELCGLITFKDIQKKKNFPQACKDTHGRLRVGAALGVTSDTMERVEALISNGVDAVFVDTAHGHSRGVLDMVKKIRNQYPELQIIGGNIATAAAAKALVESGVNAVKVGIGPGSICTTRIIAGVGVPQLTAVMNVADGLKGTGVPLIADGGIKQTGDIAKAIAAGADSVMIGSMFAGHEESPGEKIIYEGRSYKMYRGMGSIGAMKKGSADRYFQDMEDEIAKFVPEGIEGRVPYKGKVGETIYQLKGGLRASLGYCGCQDIDTMKQQAKFMKITNAGVKESHPHSIRISKEAPNYFV